ncbi:MAG: proteasome subunit beta [Mycobacteriales bacterium]
MAAPGVTSFSTFLGMTAPQLLPGSGRFTGVDGSTNFGATNFGVGPDFAPHGTTIVAATFDGGVVLAGDRRATQGHMIAHRDMEKVFPADPHSAVGVAGTAGIATELVRLYQVELEHYEKLEGVQLSLRGKAHRLSSMIRGNLGLAMQGMVVVPLLAGFDIDAVRDKKAVRAGVSRGHSAGRIYSYDPTGSMHEERHYHSVGSGSVFAKSALKKLYRPGATADDVVQMCVEALYDAADDDSATGGPDVTRKLYPTVLVIDAAGVRRIGEPELASIVASVLHTRTQNPAG